MGNSNPLGVVDMGFSLAGNLVDSKYGLNTKKWIDEDLTNNAEQREYLEEQRKAQEELQEQKEELWDERNTELDQREDSAAKTYAEEQNKFDRAEAKTKQLRRQAQGEYRLAVEEYSDQLAKLKESRVRRLGETTRQKAGIEDQVASTGIRGGSVFGAISREDQRIRGDIAAHAKYIRNDLNRMKSKMDTQFESATLAYQHNMADIAGARTVARGNYDALLAGFDSARESLDVDLAAMNYQQTTFDMNYEQQAHALDYAWVNQSLGAIGSAISLTSGAMGIVGFFGSQGAANNQPGDV